MNCNKNYLIINYITTTIEIVEGGLKYHGQHTHLYLVLLLNLIAFVGLEAVVVVDIYVSPVLINSTLNHLILLVYLPKLD